MGTTVAMTYAPVEAASKGFQQQAQMFRVISKATAALVQILRATAFASAGTGLALASYLESRVQKNCEKTAKLCEEFSEDLKRAVEDHKSGDYKAGSYFGEGIR